MGVCNNPLSVRVLRKRMIGLDPVRVAALHNDSTRAALTNSGIIRAKKPGTGSNIHCLLRENHSKQLLERKSYIT